MPVRTPIEEVAGNASDDQKEGINDAMSVYCQETRTFCYGISDRMRLVEATETGRNISRVPIVSRGLIDFLRSPGR